SARLAWAQRARSARLAWAQRARSALPRVQSLKQAGARAAQWLPQAKRLLPDRKRLQRAKRLLPKAARWTRRAVRSAPRSAVVTAPFVALFVIWLVHGLARHAPVVLPTTARALPASVSMHLAAHDSAESAAAIAATVAPPALTATALPPPVADDAELRAALAQGLPAMEALSAKYTADPQVLVALASSEAQAQRYEAAISTVDRAIDATPSSAQSGKIMGILWRAAQSSASEEAFGAMRKLGGRGSDVEFDLATTPGVRDAIRDRAKAELTNHMGLDASADTRAATALLLAPDCATRKSLLERAESEGGKRTLAMLERFAHGVGCTSSSEGSCNACLMGSPILASALTKLNAAVKP
ncbi:MAG TPA: hypothetical protein VNW92_27910, partial [Polyangiaceae bacterium]|nr:hypothetical protein [Polyangiaceae bacterium]